MDPAKKRIGREIYWNIRRTARSVRAFLTDQYPGKREGLLFRELFLAGENVELMVTDAWKFGRTAEVNRLLDNSDVTEHCLTRLAAEVSYLLTGDSQMRDEIQSCRPPGGKHLVPDAEVIRTRDVSKQQFLQHQRVHKGVNYTEDASEAAGPGGRRRQRRGGGRGRGADGKGGGKGGAAAPPK